MFIIIINYLNFNKYYLRYLNYLNPYYVLVTMIHHPKLPNTDPCDL